MSALGLSRYMPEILEMTMHVKAKASYVFFVDGDRGTGGSPLIMGAESLKREVYEARCRELILLLRRSAKMLEDDLARQGFGRPEAP